MNRYRKKPVVIEAMQLTIESRNRVYDWITCNKVTDFDSHGNPIISIETLEGWIKAHVGDYVIKGVKGEFYPCEQDIFEMTYEKVDKGGES